MEKLFVPYTGNVPAALDIKGHRVLIISSQIEDIAKDLELVGGEEVREIELPDNDGTKVLADLAADINGGVVLTPPGVSPRDMIESLESELPWIH